MADVANGFDSTSPTPSKRPRLDKGSFSALYVGISDAENIPTAPKSVNRERIDSQDAILDTSMMRHCDEDAIMAAVSSVECVNAAGVTPTRDGEVFNGGDSGFNDLTPPASADCLDSLCGDTQMENCEDIFSRETSEPHGSTSDTFMKIRKIKKRRVDDSDDDDVASTLSDLSGFSDLSDMSGQEWKPTAGPMEWVHRHMVSGSSPRALLSQLLPQSARIPDQLDDLTLWKVIISMVNEPPRRKKLTHANSLDDVLQLLRSCKNIIILTGAGVSVSCGIPDFRSRDGIYARLARDFPDLPDPQSMFDIQYFKKDSRPFFKFAKEIYPGQFQPSLCHRFIRLLEERGKLLRNYSQNIDTLERVAGIKRVIECHGSFATATCLICKNKVDADFIREDVFDQKIPRCPKCPPDSELSVMKPDIVFFGEGLPGLFHKTITKDKDQCDLFIVVGSSLKVRPVALIPSSIPADVPQILINREPLPHLCFDVELLGDCDVIINEICNRLGAGWDHLCYNTSGLTEIKQLPVTFPLEPNVTFEENAVAAMSDEQSENCCEIDVSRTSSSNVLEVVDAESTAVLEESVVNSYETRHDVSNEEEANPKNGVSGNVSGTESLASRLPANTFLACSSSRFIFHGAEVYAEYESDAESDLPNVRLGSSSNSDSSDEEEAGPRVDTSFQSDLEERFVITEELGEEICRVAENGVVFSEEENVGRNENGDSGLGSC